MMSSYSLCYLDSNFERLLIPVLPNTGTASNMQMGVLMCQLKMNVWVDGGMKTVLSYY